MSPRAGMIYSMCCTVACATGWAGAQFIGYEPSLFCGHMPCTTNPKCRLGSHSLEDVLPAWVAQNSGAQDRASATTATIQPMAKPARVETALLFRDMVEYYRSAESEKAGTPLHSYKWN